jgi:hypothetical protein
VTVAGWWCLGVALDLLAGALFAGSVVILAAANPSERLPWLGWPSSRPPRAVALLTLATISNVIAMTFVTEALGRRHLYDVLWDGPVIVALSVGGIARQAQHNRRVQRGMP